MKSEIVVREARAEDADWVAGILREAWGSMRIVTRGRLHDAEHLPTLIAHWRGERAGCLTYRLEGDECEVMSLNSALENRGAGGALLEAVLRIARAARLRACRPAPGRLARLAAPQAGDRRDRDGRNPPAGRDRVGEDPPVRRGAGGPRGFPVSIIPIEAVR